MQTVVYILHSPSANQFYVGVTKDLVGERIRKHNEKVYGAGFTAKADDWVLVLEISCESFSQGVRIERHIKRMKSKKYIESLVRYPELRAKLAAQYAEHVP